jgi:hypothetical protein
MRLAAAVFGIALAAAPAAFAQDGAPAGQLNTLKDIHNALRKCWIWPSELDSSGNMDLTIMLSFRANGDIFGGRITHVSRAVSDNERALYFAALQGMIGRCAHLPVSASLGQAIAGQPFIFRIVDTRRQKGA